MNTLELIVARFPLGMAFACVGLVILLFILLIVRTLQNTGREIDQDRNNE